MPIRAHQASFFFTFIICSIFPTRGNAQTFVASDSSIAVPEIYASVGVYFPDIRSRFRVDGSRGLGTDIQLEDALRLTSSMSVFRADVLGKISKRSQLAASFTSLQRSSDFSIDEPIAIFDTILDVNTRANFFFDTYYYALTWRYSFFDEVNWNAGLSAGLRLVQFNSGIDATLNGSTFQGSEKVRAPAILFGVHGAGYLTPRLLARYSLEYFQIEVVGVGIQVIETRASIEYFISKNIGLGAAYSTNEYLVEDIPLSDFSGKVEFEFGGFNLFATARF